MKTKKPTVNFLTDTIPNHITAKHSATPGNQGGVTPCHPKNPLYRLLSEWHMLLICIQDVKRLFVSKNPNFLRFWQEFFPLTRK